MADETRLHSVGAEVILREGITPDRRIHSVGVDVVSTSSETPGVRALSVMMDVVTQVVPGVPVNLRQVESTGSSVTIAWDISPHGIVPDSFEVKLGEGGVVSTGSSPHVIYGLQDPHATYSVFVRAVRGSTVSRWAMLQISPSIITSFDITRLKRISTISLKSEVVTFSPSAIRRRREATIGLIQGIRVQFSIGRRRRVSSLVLERQVISLFASSVRQRRLLIANLSLQSNNLSVTATRRHRVSNLGLERTAASISFVGVRKRRASNIRVVVPDIFLQPTMVRRPRIADVRLGPTVMSMSDGTTEVLMLHSDGVWRNIELAIF